MSEDRRPIRVLVVEDNPRQREGLLEELRFRGYEPRGVATGEQALEEVENEPPDLVVLDLGLPKMSGLETLDHLKKRVPQARVVVLTGEGSGQAGFQAAQGGAFAYLEKSSEEEHLFVTLQRAAEALEMQRRVRALELGVGPDAIVGRSAALRRVLETVDKVATSSAKVLLMGDNGTGKDLIARYLHARSRRAEGPFVKLNCAAIPRDLVESELFGHEKGAFTGAVQSKKGKFELADGGSLFLDEIGDLGQEAQAKLLRAIETGEMERVGGTRLQVVDVRLIAATNKDLQEEVREGRFREDLYFRLNVVPVRVPPLAERREDVPMLADHFLAHLSAEEGLDKKELTPAALRLLEGYSWPGNVRELRNLMERAAVLVDGPQIDAADLESWLEPEPALEASGGGGASDLLRGGGLKGELEREEAERIRRELETSRWNVTQAALKLGLDRTNLHRKMRKYGIRRREEEGT